LVGKEAEPFNEIEKDWEGDWEAYEEHVEMTRLGY
jgi:hypothetical protein